VAQTYPSLADRLTRETGQRVVTGILRGAGDSGGDFSAQGWLDDLGGVIGTEVPAEARRWLVGFGLGGVLALRVAADDERVAGVACLGTPVDLGAMAREPRALVERCARSGVLRTPGYPSDPELLQGRPLLVVHGADDPDVSIDEARALSDAATGPSDLRVIYGAGHWLRADPRVIAILVGWLERRR
jgi:putative redox protein